MSLNPANLQLLSAYVDGELPAAERESVERALAADPRLRQIEQSMRGLGSAVRALSEAEVKDLEHFHKNYLGYKDEYFQTDGRWAR